MKRVSDEELGNLEDAFAATLDVLPDTVFYRELLVFRQFVTEPPIFLKVGKQHLTSLK